MKKDKILFAIGIFSFLIFTPTLTQAQFIKGNWLIEGSVGSINIQNGTSETEYMDLTSKAELDEFSLSIYPSAGYFIDNDFVIGLGFGFNHLSVKINYFDNDGYNTTEYNYSSNQISFAPFIRYYLPVNENTKLRFYGQCGGGITFELSRSDESINYDRSGQVTRKYEAEYTENPFSFFIEGLLGLNYFIAENVALNGALGYNYSKETQSVVSRTTDSNGVETKSEEGKNTGTDNTFIWSVGFTMIIP